MSEFSIHHTHDEIAEAHAKLDAHIASTSSATMYIDALERSYKDIPQGASSIHRMLRVAKFVRQIDTRDSFWQSTEAFYNGELLASNLLDYLRDEEATGGDLAHSFLNYRLMKSQPRGSKPESAAHQEARHFDVAQTINDQLMAFSIPPIEQYEPIADQYLDRISPNARFRAIARSGFRMVMLEAVDASSNADIAPTLESIAHVPNYRDHVTLASETPEPGAAVEEIPEELKALEASFQSGELSETYEDRSRFKKILLDHYRKMLVNHKELGMLGPTTEEAIRKQCESELTTLNHEEKFFNADDLLVITGEYYARTAFVQEDGGEEMKPILARFTDDFEVRGRFGGIFVIKAPQPKEIHQSDSVLGEYKNKTGIENPFIPAIRIIEPAVITFDDKGGIEPTIGEFEYVDIPLIYKTFQIERPL